MDLRQVFGTDWIDYYSCMITDRLQAYLLERSSREPSGELPGARARR